MLVNIQAHIPQGRLRRIMPDFDNDVV